MRSAEPAIGSGEPAMGSAEVRMGSADACAAALGRASKDRLDENVFSLQQQVALLSETSQTKHFHGPA